MLFHYFLKGNGMAAAGAKIFQPLFGDADIF
jgi:hypothetical protein